MGRIELAMVVRAPIERCFDLSRSVDAHVQSTASTGERAVGGVLTGLMALGDTVTWEARHFGVRQRLTSRITAFTYPSHFRDSQVSGAFSGFDHDHHFVQLTDSTTEIRDVFVFAAPFGPLGAMVERILLTDYMRRFLMVRNQALKELLESDGWKRYLPAGTSVGPGPRWTDGSM